MTRALQKRLALAIEAIEPKLAAELLKRKRPTSSGNEIFSDSSSSISDPLYARPGLDSSPISAGGLFSDELARSGSSRGSKRAKYRSVSHIIPSNPHSLRSHRNTHSHSGSWKRNHRLPESSPAMRGQPTLSFVTEVSAADDAHTLSQSEEDDADLPLHSFQVDARQIQSSPPRYPRTPSPGASRSGRLRNKAFNHSTRQDDAADLLMLLATSPSPAVNSKTRNMNPPSTPPQKTPLPSSILNTPGGGSNFVGLGAATPGFNFSDFLNVTPSPAQAAWRTPATAKTPNTTRAHHRRLNFDTLVPPGTSADMPSKSVTGLGMDLGGELVSSQ
jgi:hypothetical protein